MKQNKLTSPAVIKKLLKKQGISLKKSLGQHFLCDQQALHAILKSADITKKDQILEIGAGIGTLTFNLAKRAKKVTAVEIDKNLASILATNMGKWGINNVDIRSQDFLTLNLPELLQQETKKGKAVGNLPYGATSPILEKLVQNRDFFSACFLTMQLEVAQRITAPVGAKEGSSLGVMIQSFAQCDLIQKISPGAFFPPPEVHSALVGIKFLEKPRFSTNEKIYFKVIRSAFNLRRKTIRNALAQSIYFDLDTHQAEEALEKAKIDKNRRGETLTIQEFDRLAKEIKRQRDYIKSEKAPPSSDGPS